MLADCNPFVFFSLYNVFVCSLFCDSKPQLVIDFFAGFCISKVQACEFASSKDCLGIYAGLYAEGLGKYDACLVGDPGQVRVG